MIAQDRAAARDPSGRGSGGCHSTSKKRAYRLARPFSSTSHHHGLSGVMAMWLGTMSSTIPSPCARAAATKRGETLLAAELWIDPVRSHHVVAVRAPGRGLQDGREVQMADAQLCQVRHDLARGREVEVAVQLQPVRRQRHVLATSGHAAAPLGGSVRRRTITHRPSTLQRGAAANCFARLMKWCVARRVQDQLPALADILRARRSRTLSCRTDSNTRKLSSGAGSLSAFRIPSPLT